MCCGRRQEARHRHPEQPRLGRAVDRRLGCAGEDRGARGRAWYRATARADRGIPGGRGASALDACGAAVPDAGGSVALADPAGDRGSARASGRNAHRSANRARGRSAFRAIHADYRGAGCAARTARRGTAQAAVQAAALAAFQAAARGADRGLDRGLRSGSVTSFTGQGQIDTVRAPSGPVARPGRFHPVLYFREP